MDNITVGNVKIMSRKKNILATSWNWENLEEKPNGITIVDFSVFKKTLFGGYRKLWRYDGWCIGFSHHSNGDIDLKTIHVQDGNFEIRPFNADLVIGVLRSLEMELTEKGQTQKSNIVKKACTSLINQYMAQILS